jgi:hypothetical protein
VGGNAGTVPNPAMNSRHRIHHALKPLCEQPIAVGVVWERGRAPYDPRFRQFGRASAPIMPQAVHAMRGTNPAKGMWSGQRSTLSTTSWWPQCLPVVGARQ